MNYKLAGADIAPVPSSYFTEPRYLGYRDADYKQPYAKYFRERSLPVQHHVKVALLTGPCSGAFGSRISTLADEMSRSGYRHMETGYTINDDGHLVISVLTDMPGVSAEMWDWWMWWHAVEPARYKLWHPEAHLYAAYTEDRSRIKGLTDRQRGQGNSCFIDEYIGAEKSLLRASFFDPVKLGFSTPKPGNTIIAARGGSSNLPIAAAWIVHQVRETPSGCEMRSRFITNDMRVLPRPAHSVTGTIGKLLTLPVINHAAGLIINRSKPAKLHEVGPAMLYHCAQEMNHLASFLPQLYKEFVADSRV
jgi:hypothetical protein